MKTKKLFLLAAMLVMSVCSFAQNDNTPLKGDVNEDGQVDVADIVAILKIMKDAGGTAGETTYYWYAGTTLPTENNLASIYTGSVTSKPTTWTDDPQSVSITNNTGSSTYFYYCFPTEWNVTIYAEDKVTEMALADVSTFTLNNVEYTVKRMGRKQGAGATQNLYAKC